MATKNPIALEVIVGIAIVVLIAVVIYAVTQPGLTTTSIITSTIAPSTYPSTFSSTSTTTIQQVSECPNVNYMQNNTIVNTTGFETYNVSGHDDYVLGPGDIGSINYTTIITPINGLTPNILNNSQIVAWGNQIQYPISGPNFGSAVNSSVSGLSVSFVTSMQNITQNSKEYDISATFYARANATNQTYVITLGPGLPLCGAEMALITIGTKPYNGTVPNLIINSA
jgi:hypothetical protein